MQQARIDSQVHVDPLEAALARGATYSDYIDLIVVDPRWSWTLPWWRTGCVIAQFDGGSATEVKDAKDKQVPWQVSSIGCSGHDGKGVLHWIGWDLDVGHGGVSYASLEDAIKDARKLREALGEAEIRRSKSGTGIHVKFLLPPDCGLTQKNASKIAKHVSRRLGLQSDPAALGRQAFWLWSRETGDLGFEAIETQSKLVLDLPEIVLEALAASENESAICTPNPHAYTAADDLSDRGVEAASLECWKPGPFDGRSPLGVRNWSDIRYLAWDWALPLGQALSIIQSKGADICADEKQWQRMMKYTRYPRGWAARKHLDSVAASATSNLIDDHEITRHEYERPQWSEVLAAIKDTPLETYIREGRRLGPGLPEEFLLLDAIQLAGLVLAAKRTTTVLDDWDSQPIWTNVYALKLARSGKGKGLTTGILLSAIQRAGVIVIEGQSEPAIIGFCKENQGAPFGLYYLPEIKKVLDQGNAVATQVVNTFLQAYDQGKLAFSIRPRGTAMSNIINPAYPSLLLEGQPLTVENSPGTRTLDSGFIARFLVAAPTMTSKSRFRRTGSPNIEAILHAYECYAGLAYDRKVTRPSSFRSRGDDFSEHMTDAEASCWERLGGQYVPRIAMMIDVAGLKAGSISQEAMDRAAVIADWFFAGSRSLLKLIHHDKHEAQRCRAERYIAEHPGCSDRDLYRHLHCSKREFEQDYAPTIILRGGAYKVDVCWHPTTETATCGAPETKTTSEPTIPAPTVVQASNVFPLSSSTNVPLREKPAEEAQEKEGRNFDDFMPGITFGF